MILDYGFRKVVENFVKSRGQYFNRFVGSISNHELKSEEFSTEKDMVN